MTKKLFPRGFKDVVTKVTTETVKNGCRKSGLFQFNADGVDYTKCVIDHQIHYIEELADDSHLFHLKSGISFIEERIGYNKTQLFNSTHGKKWYGDIEDTSLFSLWSSIKELGNSMCHEESICDMPSTETLLSPSQAEESSVQSTSGSLGLPVSKASEGSSALLVPQASEGSSDVVVPQASEGSPASKGSSSAPTCQRSSAQPACDVGSSHVPASHLRVSKGSSGVSTCRGSTSVPVSEGSPVSKGSSSAHEPPSAQHVGLPCCSATSKGSKCKDCILPTSIGIINKHLSERLHSLNQGNQTGKKRKRSDLLSML